MRRDPSRRWQQTGLLTFEDKNEDGRIQYYNDDNTAFRPVAEGYGWEGNYQDAVASCFEHSQNKPSTRFRRKSLNETDKGYKQPEKHSSGGREF